MLSFSMIRIVKSISNSSYIMFRSTDYLVFFFSRFYCINYSLTIPKKKTFLLQPTLKQFVVFWQSVVYMKHSATVHSILLYNTLYKLRLNWGGYMRRDILGIIECYMVFLPLFYFTVFIPLFMCNWRRNLPEKHNNNIIIII